MGSVLTQATESRYTKDLYNDQSLVYNRMLAQTTISLSINMKYLYSFFDGLMLLKKIIRGMGFWVKTEASTERCYITLYKYELYILR